MTGKDRDGSGAGTNEPAKPTGKPGEATTSDIAPKPGPKPPGTGPAVSADDTTFAVPATAPATSEPS